MIVVMKRNATQEMIQRMARRVESMGLKAHVIVGTERTVIAAIGDKRDGAAETLLSCEEVEKVVPILAPYKVASRETTPPSVANSKQPSASSDDDSDNEPLCEKIGDAATV